jgi:hypothetical protein
MALDGVSGQRHTLAMLYPRGKDPGSHWIGCWVGLRAGLVIEARGKTLCLCWGSNPGRPVCSQPLYYWATPAPIVLIRRYIIFAFTGNVPAMHYAVCHSLNANDSVNCVQPISLGLIRSDIMLESECLENTCSTTVGPYCCWKQVEVNTIASGFGWLGPASASIHRSALLCS